MGVSGCTDGDISGLKKGVRRRRRRRRSFRVYNTVIDECLRLGISTVRGSNFVYREDLIPLYERKIFSFRNFCRYYNFEKSSIQWYCRYPLRWQRELQCVKRLLEYMPDIVLVRADIFLIESHITKFYGSVFNYCIFQKVYTRPYFYRLFHGLIDLRIQRNYMKYISLMRDLGLPIRLDI